MDTPEPLNEQLADIADAIAVDDPQMSLRAVRTTAVRRRRRRNVFAGSVAVAFLVGGVLVVGGVPGNDDTDSIAIDGARSETPTTDETSGPGDVDPDADGSGDPPTEPTTPVTEVPTPTPLAPTRVDAIAVNATPISIGGDVEAAESDVEWIVPWQDGFLAGRVNFTPQPLPSELPEEVSALFPQEVLDLFVDGLPATIDEATVMLSEAGLLDEVTAVLSEHPEANEAVFSAGSKQEPDYDVVFSVDGADWEAVDFTVPAGTYGLYGVQSTGTRLALATQTYDEPADGNLWGRADQVGDIVVATTTDLVNWDLTTVDVGERPADLPDALFYSVSPGELAIDDNGWVLPTTVYSDIQVESLLPADVLERVQRSNGGFGSSWDDTGVTIEVYDGSPTAIVPGEPGSEVEYQEPSVTETLTFTWAELGVDPQDLDAVDDQPESSVYAANWGSPPVEVEGVQAWSISSGGDGFYAVNGSGLSYSPDGVSWVTLDAPVEEMSFGLVRPIPGGVLLFGSDFDGATQVFRVSGADGTWELLEIPGVPTAFHDMMGNGSQNAAMIAQGSEPEEIEPTEITVESDGYTMVMREARREVTVTVSDSAGDVVTDETHRWLPDDEPETWRYSRSGVEILDPESGDVVVTFGNATMETAYREQTDRYDDLGNPDQFEPDLWLIATLTGDRWLVEDLDATMDFDRFLPGALAINGSTLIVNGGDGWLRYDLS